MAAAGSIAILTMMISFLLLLSSCFVSARSANYTDPLAVQPEHIFLLAGQSNMVGHGGMGKKYGEDFWNGVVPPECQPKPEILRFSFEQQWTVAREPIHKGIYPGYQKVTGIGPSMPFARQLLNLNRTFGTIGLVPCARNWSHMREWGRGTVLYKKLIERARESIRGGGKIAALWWWQGGSDANNHTEALAYKPRLEQFFNNVRDDLGNDLLIIMIIIPCGRAEFSGIIRDAQLSIDLPRLLKIDPPANLPLESDGIHTSTEGQVILGRLTADVYFPEGRC